MCAMTDLVKPGQTRHSLHIAMAGPRLANFQIHVECERAATVIVQKAHAKWAQ